MELGFLEITDSADDFRELSLVLDSILFLVLCLFDDPWPDSFPIPDFTSNLFKKPMSGNEKLIFIVSFKINNTIHKYMTQNDHS